MNHCFVHAPNKDGWNGILLLHLEKEKGRFQEKNVRKIFEMLYPHEDFYECHYDPAPSEQQIAHFNLRQEKGMMQRISAVMSYEDITFREWRQIMRQHYPPLAAFVRMLRKFSNYEEEPSLP